MKVDVDLAPVLKALAEPLRWQIVQALAREELCVCHLVDELAAPQPLISHHLRVLREVGLVESEKWRYWTYYRLCSDGLTGLAAQLDELVASCPAPSELRRPCC